VLKFYQPSVLGALPSPFILNVKRSHGLHDIPHNHVLKKNKRSTKITAAFFNSGLLGGATFFGGGGMNHFRLAARFGGFEVEG